ARSFSVDALDDARLPRDARGDLVGARPRVKPTPLLPDPHAPVPAIGRQLEVRLDLEVMRRDELPDRAVAPDDEGERGRLAAGERVDEVEDELALAARVGGVDDRGDVGPREERLDDFELVGGPLVRPVAERLGDDGQVAERPPRPPRIVDLRVLELDEVADG